MILIDTDSVGSIPSEIGLTRRLSRPGKKVDISSNVLVTGIPAKDGSLIHVIRNQYDFYAVLSDKIVFVLKTKPSTIESVIQTSLSPNAFVREIVLSHCDKSMRGKGVGKIVYDAVLKEGIFLVSNETQTGSAKSVWRKLWSQPIETGSVYVYDGSNIVTDGDSPMRYNGTNLPDANIWSVWPDTSRREARLILTRGI